MAHGVIPDEHRWRCFFHMTDISNVESILQNGLLCTNERIRRGITHADIANGMIQERRSNTPVTCGPGGTVHDYVPFYFTSISPMLLSLVLSKNYEQADMVFICLKIDKLLSLDAIFTDASANTVVPPNFYDDVAQLSQLSWDKIDDRRWRWEDVEERHKKMAEVLIYNKVDPQDIEAIVVSNKERKRIVEKYVSDAGLTIRVCFECYGVYGDDMQCYFYYKKWNIKGMQRHSWVTGPKELCAEYKGLMANVKECRMFNNPSDYRFQTIADILSAIHENFCVIPELEGIYRLETSNPQHHMTVSDHTIDVVDKIKQTDYYQQADEHQRELMELAAYLHDIGKGPKSKWRDGIQPVYPDHPADAIPMLVRIFSEEIAELSDEDMRVLALMVVYHDIIGDHMSKKRKIEVFKPLIVSDADYDMLAALTEADIKSIDVMWWCEYIANKRRLRNEFLAHE